MISLLVCSSPVSATANQALEGSIVQSVSSFTGGILKWNVKVRSQLLTTDQTTLQQQSNTENDMTYRFLP